MAERPTPSSLLLSALICLTSLPADHTLPSSVDLSTRRLLFDDDDPNDGNERSSEDADADTDADNDGRHPNLTSCCSNGTMGGAASARVVRSTPREERMWDALRQVVEEEVIGSGGGSAGGGMASSSSSSPIGLLSKLRSTVPPTRSTKQTSRGNPAHPSNDDDNNDNDDDDDNDNDNDTTSRSPDALLLAYLSRHLTTVDSLHEFFIATLTPITKGGGMERTASAVGTHAPIDPDCLLGVYLRKRVLGFDMLGFESVTMLWEECVGWLEVGWGWVKDQEQERSQKRDSAGGIGNGNGNGNGGGQNEINPAAAIAGRGGSWPSTSTQIASELHSLCLTGGDTAAAAAAAAAAPATTGEAAQSPPLPPLYETTMEHLATLSQHHPTLPQLHLAKFLSCLRHGERIGAVEALHRYFDYAVIAGRREAVGRLIDGVAVGGGGADGAANRRRAAAGGGGGAGGGDGDPLKPLSRYAPLLLAMLHHSHGQYGLARKAAEEAMRIGYQSSDDDAVTIALAWLALIGQEVGTAAMDGGASRTGGEELWSLSRSRAAQYGPTSLCARSSLALAQGRVQPGSSSSSSANGMAGAAGATGTSATAGATSRTASATATALPAASPSHLAAAWTDLATSTTTAPRTAAAAAAASQPAGAAAPHLAGMGPAEAGEMGAPQDCPTAILPVTSSSNQMLDDIDQATRLQALLGSGLWDSVARGDLSAIESRSAVLQRGGSISNLSAAELALAATKIAMKALEGGASSVGAANDGTTAHERCLEELIDLYRANPRMDAEVWSNTVALVLHDWSTRLGLDGSSTSGVSLTSSIRLHLSSRIAGSAWDGSKCSADKIESVLLLMEAQAMSFESEKRYKEAMDIMSRAISLASSKGLHSHRARCLLCHVKLRLDCIPSEPVLVLPSLLECLSECETYAIDAIHAAALSTLGKVHLLMGNCRMARSVLDAALPTMIQSASSDIVAETLVTLVKCDLALMKDGGQSDKRLLKRSLSLLSKAECYSLDMINVRSLQEVYYLRAQVCHCLGPEYLSERDAASKGFVGATKWLQKGSQNPDTIENFAPSKLLDPAATHEFTRSLSSMSKLAMSAVGSNRF